MFHNSRDSDIPPFGCARRRCYVVRCRYDNDMKRARATAVEHLATLGCEMRPSCLPRALSRPTHAFSLWSAVMDSNKHEPFDHTIALRPPNTNDSFIARCARAWGRLFSVVVSTFTLQSSNSTLPAAALAALETVTESFPGHLAELKDELYAVRDELEASLGDDGVMVRAFVHRARNSSACAWTQVS